jgi:hypothetical protein
MKLLLVGNWFGRFASAAWCLGLQGVVSVLSDEGSSGTRVLGGPLPVHRAPSFINPFSSFSATFTRLVQQRESRKWQM